MRRLPLALCLALFLAPVAAPAHTASVSYSELEVHGNQLDAQLHFSSIDLLSVIRLDTQSQAQLDSLQPALARLLLEPVQVNSGGKPCALQPGRAAPDGPDGASIRAVFICPAPIEELSVRPGFIDIFPQGHTHLAKIVFSPSEVFQRVAQAEEPRFEVTRAPRPLARAAGLLWLGAQQEGPVQLVVLLALLLIAGTLFELIQVVAALSLACSIALSFAALGPLALPAHVLAVLLALGALVAAAENLWALGGAGRVGRALARRWVLAFALGLAQGFAAGGALADQPRRGLVPGLLAFNLGFELVLLAAAALFALLARRLRARPGLLRLASGACGAAALAWLCVRLVRA